MHLDDIPFILIKIIQSLRAVVRQFDHGKTSLYLKIGRQTFIVTFCHKKKLKKGCHFRKYRINKGKYTYSCSNASVLLTTFLTDKRKKPPFQMAFSLLENLII
jgi:hypothetical protein